MTRSTLTRFRLALVIGGAILLPSCNVVGTVIDDLFLSDIGNVWTVDGQSDHTFFFLPEESGEVSQSSFTGNETLPDGSESPLQGTFKNRDISFTVTRGSRSVEFSGTFRSENVMDLRSQGRTMVLRKGSGS